MVKIFVCNFYFIALLSDNMDTIISTFKKGIYSHSILHRKFMALCLKATLFPISLGIVDSVSFTLGF